jgi:hypothetical protein
MVARATRGPGLGEPGLIAESWITSVVTTYDLAQSRMMSARQG